MNNFNQQLLGILLGVGIIAALTLCMLSTYIYLNMHKLFEFSCYLCDEQYKDIECFNYSQNYAINNLQNLSINDIFSHPKGWSILTEKN